MSCEEIILLDLYRARVFLPKFFSVVDFFQAMSCEGACAHAHVRCAVARVRVRAKSILKSVRDVRACVRLVFRRAMCDHTFAHFLGQIARKCYFLSQKYSRTRISYPDLEHFFLFWIILFCFRTSYSLFEHPKP